MCEGDTELRGQLLKHGDRHAGQYFVFRVPATSTKSLGSEPKVLVAMSLTSDAGPCSSACAALSKAEGGDPRSGDRPSAQAAAMSDAVSSAARGERRSGLTTRPDYRAPPGPIKQARRARACGLEACVFGLHWPDDRLEAIPTLEWPELRTRLSASPSLV